MATRRWTPMSDYTITVPDEAHRDALEALLYELAERPWVAEEPVGRHLLNADIEVEEGGGDE